MFQNTNDSDTAVGRVVHDTHLARFRPRSEPRVIKCRTRNRRRHRPGDHESGEADNHGERRHWRRRGRLRAAISSGAAVASEWGRAEMRPFYRARRAAAALAPHTCAGAHLPPAPGARRRAQVQMRPSTGLAFISAPCAPFALTAYALRFAVRRPQLPFSLRSQIAK